MTDKCTPNLRWSVEFPMLSGNFLHINIGAMQNMTLESEQEEEI